MQYYSLPAAKRTIVVGGCLAMAYTQLTTSPATVEFARSLGANGFHIGVLGALPTGLFFAQFLSACMSNHLTYRRPLWFWTAILHRLSLAPVAIAAWWVPEISSATMIWTLLLLMTLNQATFHFAAPLWLSWMGDYLPKQGLSQFWSVRHTWQQWTAAIALLGGAAVYWSSGLPMHVAFSVLIGFATVVGVIDILLFLKVEEPPVSVAKQTGLVDVLAAPFRDRNFRSFIGFSCFWHFSAMIGAPFISMYLLEHVGMSLFQVLILWALSWVGGASLSRWFGDLVEHYGNRPVLILCTTLKAVNMFALLLTPANPNWAFVVLVPVLMMDAQLNAGINIANNSYMLRNSPQENRTMFLAAGTALAGMIGGITAIVSGYVLMQIGNWNWQFQSVTIVGFHVLFLTSLVLRVTSIFVARGIVDPGAKGMRVLVRETTARWSERWPILAAPLSAEPESPELPTTSLAAAEQSRAA